MGASKICLTLAAFCILLSLSSRRHDKSSLLSSQLACKPPAKGYALTYAAPRYFPFPPFRIVLETEPGLCDLGAPAVNFTPRVVTGNRGMGVPKLTKVERQAYCKAFEQAQVPVTGNGHTTLMPEPFVVQAIASSLGHCPACGSCCRAVDIGANVGFHATYMAALGATVDAIEPSADLAAALRASTRANCWDRRVRVQQKAITADESGDGTHIKFKGGWRRDDPTMEKRRRHSVELVSIQRLLRGRKVQLLKIDIDNSEIEMQLFLELARMLHANETQVDAVVVELSSAPARRQTPKAKRLAVALGQMQTHLGYNIYRLAHHLHSMAALEPWYSPCVGVRGITYMLHVKHLDASGWLRLLELRADQPLGRSDTASFFLTTAHVGRGAEGRWRSESMDKSLPKEWLNFRCGP